MLNAYHIAAAGLQAEQKHIEVVSQNLSNLNTVAYKRMRPVFKDVVMVSAAVTNGPLSRNEPMPSAGYPGRGVYVADYQSVFQAGELKVTGRVMDLAINGQGFFEALTPAGDQVYSRNGSFRLDADGYLVNEQGYPLSGIARFPAGWSDLQVGSDGEVSVLVGDDTTRVPLGYLEVAMFMDPESLARRGDGVYAPMPASGLPSYVRPGEDGSGALVQGALESSNVDMVEELLQMMLAQRAYQANSQVMRAADAMWQVVNSLRG